MRQDEAGLRVLTHWVLKRRESHWWIKVGSAVPERLEKNRTETVDWCLALLKCSYMKVCTLLDAFDVSCCCPASQSGRFAMISLRAVGRIDE
jgi:hypothetical protein